MARVRGRTIGLGALALMCVGVASACGSDNGTANAPGATGTSGASGASGNSENGGASASSNAGGVNGQTQVGVDANLITGQTQCSNGIDDDGDGLIDGFDGECTGPLDNDESSFATGISGDNSDACKQDCFFDGNSGSGNDGCLWNLKCDPASPGAHADKPCPYDATYKNCDDTQTQACIDYCRQYTPNGCDCFGCCTIFAGTIQADVKIGSACSIDKINDTTACPRCTKTTACANDCGACELCLGKTVADLPASCTPTPTHDAGPPPPDAAPPPPTYTCDTPGAVRCSPTEPCLGGAYCAQGCCMSIH